MARITPVDPATVTGKSKELLDGPLAGKHFNIFRSMAQSPAALQAYLGLSGAVASGGLNAKEREVIQLAVGEANNCGYCVAAHTAIGKGAGLTEPQTVEARRAVSPSRGARHAEALTSPPFAGTVELDPCPSSRFSSATRLPATAAMR
jgi:AhpD family alkylhydroperoxidase